MEFVIESLRVLSNNRLSKSDQSFTRYLFGEIDWDEQMISIRGARGAGKTTMLLHRLNSLPKDGSALYVSMDEVMLRGVTLFEVAESFVQLGGRHLLLDEVHKFRMWSEDLKLVYDHFPELHVVFTSSSILELHKGEADLSRRAVGYTLKELSLREFVWLEKGIQIQPVTWDILQKNHVDVAMEINKKIKPIACLKDYLAWGAYPYFKKGKKSYHQKLLQAITLMIEVDINAVENPGYHILEKLKMLLHIISTSVPFVPNITKLSERIGVSRPTLIHLLQVLHRARLTMNYFSYGVGVGQLTKPEKIFLNNTNMAHALSNGRSDIGASRETFFANQLDGLHTLHLTEKGDFLVDGNVVVEIGGRNKTRKQVADNPSALLLKDDIEIGADRIIPLWMFGFLY